MLRRLLSTHRSKDDSLLHSSSTSSSSDSSSIRATATRRRTPLLIAAVIVSMVLLFNLIADPLLVLNKLDRQRSMRRVAREDDASVRWCAVFTAAVRETMAAARMLEGFVQSTLSDTPLPASPPSPSSSSADSRRVEDSDAALHGSDVYARFPQVASLIAHTVPSLAAQLIAPDGVVRYAWPYDATLLNRSMFNTSDPMFDRRPLPIETMTSGNVSIVSPHHLPTTVLRDAWLVTVRMPVFYVNDMAQHSADNFRGFTSTLLNLSDVIAQHNMVASLDAEGMDFLLYSYDATNGSFLVIAASPWLRNASLDTQLTFVRTAVPGTPIFSGVNLSLAVRMQNLTPMLNANNIACIVAPGVLLALLVLLALIAVIERCTRTYDGRLYAPKLTPFALLTVGPCYGEELWNLVPVQMAEVMDRLNRVLNRQMAAHRAYKVAQMQPYTTVFVLRTVEAAVHMSFDVITELQRHPIDADLATLLDEDGQLLMAYAVHLCTDVAIVPSVIGDRGYRYEGADMVYGARMWAFAAPNTVTLSAAAQPHACAMRRQRRGRGRRCAGLQVALLARVCLPHDTAAQPLYTITDTQRATLRRALAVAKAHTSKSQYVAKIVRAYCHDDGGSSSAGGGGGAVGGDDVQRAALRSGHDEMDDDGYDDDEEDDDDDDDDGYDEETSSNSSNNCSIDDGGDNADEDSAYGDGGCRAARRARLRRRTCRQSTAARDGDAAELNPLESNSLITLVDTSDYSPAAHRRSGGGGGGGAHTGSDDTATHASRTSVCVATTAAAAMSSLSSSSTSTAMTDLLLLRQQQQVQRQRRQRRAQQRQQLQQQLRQHAQHDGPCDSDVERVCSRNSSGSVVADGEPVTRARERGSALVADDNNNNDDDTMPTHVTDATATAAAASEGHDGGETALPPRRHATPARRRSQRAAHGDNARHARHYDYGNGSVSSNNSSGSNSNSSSVFAYMTARRRRTGSAGSSSYNSSVCRHSVSTTHSAAYSHTSIAHANDDNNINNNNDNDDDAPATSSPLCAHVAARSSTAVATPAKLLVTPPDTTTAAATAVVVKPTSGTPTRAAHHVAVPLSSPEATAMHHDDRDHHALSLSATRSPLVVAALRHMWSSSRSSSCSGGGDIHGHRGSGSTTHPTSGQQGQQQRQQCDDNDNNKRSRRTRRRRRQQQQPQPTTQARKSRATAWLTVEVDTMTQQLLHPVIPLWLDKALRRAFDHQSIALAISYESVRVMVYYFYASYKLLFRPLAVPERDNIYRRLITAFGIPRKDILEHLAARCTIHYMQQHEHTKSLAWKTYA